MRYKEREYRERGIEYRESKEYRKKAFRNTHNEEDKKKDRKFY